MTVDGRARQSELRFSHENHPDHDWLQAPFKTIEQD